MESLHQQRKRQSSPGINDAVFWREGIKSPADAANLVIRKFQSCH